MVGDVIFDLSYVTGTVFAFTYDPDAPGDVRMLWKQVLGPERFQGGAWGWTRKTLYLRTTDDTMLPIDRATGAIGREQAWLWEGWSAIYEDTAYVRDWVTGHIYARRLEDQ